MSLVQRIEKDFKQAMQQQNLKMVSVLRMLKTALKHKAVELIKPLLELPDEQVIAVLRTAIKQRQEAIKMYQEKGMDQLVETEEQEIKILQKYLPEQLSEEELKQKIKTIIAELPVAEQKNFGLIMKTLMGKYPGQVDGAQASQLVKQILSQINKD